MKQVMYLVLTVLISMLTVNCESNNEYQDEFEFESVDRSKIQRPGSQGF